MTDTPKLLTDAELAAIADRHKALQQMAAAECMPIVRWVKGSQEEHAGIPGLLADLQCCRAWYRRLVEAWDAASSDYNFAANAEPVLNEVRAALEE